MAGLQIHTSNRLDVLVEHLAGAVATEPLPPHEREVIIVQSQGMARWLTLKLADHSGIAASLSMPFPATFCRRLAERFEGDRPAAGQEAVSETPSPFDREPLTWRIFDRLGDAGDLTGAGGPPGGGASPATYLGDDPDQLKRYQLSVRLAGLFEGYQLFRPRMLLAWEAGVKPPEAERPEGPAADHVAWQSRLWRSLATGAGEDHLARRLARLLERLRGTGHDGARRPPCLPRRLAVFGVSTLPPAFLELAVAAARHVPVRIYFLSPTYHYWGDLRSEREAARIRRRLKTEPGAAGDHLEAGHPLLAALGRQGRDFFNLLQEADTEGAAWHDLDLVDPGDDSLLHGLQSDVLHLVDRGGADAPPRRLDSGDGSLSIHVCHSPMREMEVLRDQLLAAFEADPGLEPSDVLVMVPRIGDYSPYIEAAFSVTEAGAPTLPFTVADREAGVERPAAEAVLRLLELVGSRLTAPAVLDLLDLRPVRRAFGIAEVQVPELRRWARETNIRWGIDGVQRAADFEVPEVGANTWRAGLDRLLMGYAAGDSDELVGGVAPHAGATAGNVELLGRLAAFTDALFRHLRRLRDPRPADTWASDLKSALDDLHRAESEDEDGALERVHVTLEELHQAHVAGMDQALSRQVVHAHLARRLAEGGGGGFLGGRITFCALKPMRTIPFRVICVAGLGEGAFPRRDPRHSFDLMAAAPRPGDRSLAEDDRYLFLETLLAAEDRLILTYEGRSQKDGRPRAPSAVLSQLLDFVDRAFVAGDGRPAREHLVVEHRLHAWNPAYYRYASSGGDGDPRLFSYSRDNFLVSGGDREPPSGRPFVVAGDDADELTGDRLPDTGHALVLELPDLTELWVNPARYYCRKVLRLRLAERRQNDDAEPFDVDFLDRYLVSQWLLERRLSGAPAGEEELELLRRRGELPLADLGDAHYRRLSRRVDEFAATLPRHEPIEPIGIELAGDGWRLGGRLDHLTGAGAVYFRCADLKPKDLVRAWVSHVARAAWEAHHPSGLPLLTHLAGTDRAVTFGPLDDPRGLLERLVDGYRAGLDQPLPLFENASHAYARAARKERGGGRQKTSPLDAARHAFSGGGHPGGAPGDSADPYVALSFRDRDPLAGEPFTRWAEALWTPLLDYAEDANIPG